MPAQPGEFLPGFTAVCGAKQSGILGPGVNGVRVRERGFEVPDAFEFPWVLRAVIPEMCSGLAIIDELIADRFPGLPAIVGTLDHLAKPTAGLGSIETIRIHSRPFHVVDLPTCK